MPEMGQVDFLETLERMYKDSRILFQNGEYYNCCYLCGYILECALKYILQKFGKKQNGQLSDGELRETQTANYFSDIYPIDSAVLSANAQSCRKCSELLSAWIPS